MADCSIESCDKIAYCRGWCKAHYTHWQRHGYPATTNPRIPMGTAQDFVRQAAVAEREDACLLWPYGTARGRPMVSVGGPVMRYVGQVVLELRGQPRPSLSHGALHHCDNPLCVAWWHLYWGTQVDNGRDMIARKRGANQHGRGYA
jgi:hypothetical protein